MSRGHLNCNSRFICNYIGAVIRKNIDIKPREIIGRIESRFNIKISYIKAWDARHKAINKVFGSYEESYCSLFRFMQAISDVMPGTIHKIRICNDKQFHSIFWSFGPSIHGWRYCQPVLSLDGTFLVGEYRGTLLAAVGYDGNGGLFPLAFAIVESESNESWCWFLQMLKELIEPISSRDDLCIISDKHPGLVRGCRKILPLIAHRHCLRHLRENFKKALRRMAVADVDIICNKMYAAGNCDNDRLLKRYLAEIKNHKEAAFNWLVERDLEKWTLLEDGGRRYGHMTTNASECYNAVLKRARGLPIQGLIASVYYNLVALFYKRSKNVEAWIQKGETIFNPQCQIILRRSENDARRYPEPTIINRQEFQVFDTSCRAFRVEITSENSCTCSCKGPQLYHIPCVHAIVALAFRRIDHRRFVSDYYLLDNYKSTYEGMFHVIPDKSFWRDYDSIQGIIPLKAPGYRRRAGRPRTSRIRNTMDETLASSTRKCSGCKSVGHNIATCPARVGTTKERRHSRPPPT